MAPFFDLIFVISSPNFAFFALQQKKALQLP